MNHGSNNNRAYTIATLGGHSALDVCLGAKRHGFSTLVVCQKGREKTYTDYYKTRGSLGVVDHAVVVDKFADLTSKGVIDVLREHNSIFIPSRYCQVYCKLDELEHSFPIPMFGNRMMLRFEERYERPNQYDLLRKAGIRFPRQFKSPSEIDRLVIVKASEAARGYERGFFFASSEEEFKRTASELVKAGQISEGLLKGAVIEEYVLGVQVNLNFFYSPLNNRLEILGTDTRRQTNIDGLLRLPASEQLKVLDRISVKYVESGHIACTVKESLLEKAFRAGEAFVGASKELCKPGIIGPFSLQAAITPGPPTEEIVVFDCSLRIPGSPGTAATPYSAYLYRKPLSFGERIAMEIKEAVRLGRLDEVSPSAEKLFGKFPRTTKRSAQEIKDEMKKRW